MYKKNIWNSTCHIYCTPLLNNQIQKMIGEGGDACVIGDIFLNKVGQPETKLSTEFPALKKRLDEVTIDIQGWAVNPPQVGQIYDDMTAFQNAAGAIEELRKAFKVTLAHTLKQLE